MSTAKKRYAVIPTHAWLPWSSVVLLEAIGTVFGATHAHMETDALRPATLSTELATDRLAF